MDDPRYAKLLDHCRAGRATMAEMVDDMKGGKSKIGIGDGRGPNDRTQDAIEFYTAKITGLDRLIAEIEARDA